MSHADGFDVFCENLRAYRKIHGLSKAQMAKKLHVSVRSLNILESGHIPPRVSVDVFFRFAHLCNVPVSAVFKTVVANEKTV